MQRVLQVRSLQDRQESAAQFLAGRFLSPERRINFHSGIGVKAEQVQSKHGRLGTPPTLKQASGAAFQRGCTATAAVRDGIAAEYLMIAK